MQMVWPMRRCILPPVRPRSVQGIPCDFAFLFYSSPSRVGEHQLYPPLPARAQGIHARNVCSYNEFTTDNMRVFIVSHHHKRQGLKQMWSGIADRVAGRDEDNGSGICLLYTSPSPRDGLLSRMPSSA